MFLRLYIFMLTLIALNSCTSQKPPFGREIIEGHYEIVKQEKFENNDRNWKRSDAT